MPSDANRKQRLKPIIVGNNATGTKQPSEPSAALQVDDQNGGFLTSRLTTNQRDAIEVPADGLLIWNIDDLVLQVWVTDEWISLGSGGEGSPGSGVDLTVESETTSDTTAIIGTILPVGNGETAITIVSPDINDLAPGDRFAVVDVNGDADTSNITIDFATSGALFRGASAPDVINVAWQYAEYVYLNETTGWVRK